MRLGFYGSSPESNCSFELNVGTVGSPNAALNKFKAPKEREWRDGVHGDDGYGTDGFEDVDTFRIQL